MYRENTTKTSFYRTIIYIRIINKILYIIRFCLMISVIRLSVDIVSITIQHKHKNLNTNKHKYV